jgi:hypothetical protein
MVAKGVVKKYIDENDMISLVEKKVHRSRGAKPCDP